MGDTKQRAQGGVLIVQPALEPWPSGIARIGPVAAFAYLRWSSWGVGFEVLSAGAAITVGPLMIGVCHIERQVDAFRERRAHLANANHDTAEGGAE